jgi:hypothetical protein
MEHEPPCNRRSKASPMTRWAVLKSKTHFRSGGAKKSVAVLFSSIGAVLLAYAVVVTFVIQPPALGWLGFATVSIILLGLGALAPLAFERTRVSPQRPAKAVDCARRLLVIADSQSKEAALGDEIFARLDGAVAVHLVVPVRVSHLHFLTDDEVEERREAAETMSISVGLLRRRGVPATGSVGSDKPLESMTDALGSFPATHVLLATPPEEESYWLERGLLAKARALTAVPVMQVVVPSTPRAGPPAGKDVRLNAHTRTGAS